MHRGSGSCTDPLYGLLRCSVVSSSGVSGSRKFTKPPRHFRRETSSRRAVQWDPVADYNEHRPHTAHGDLTPSKFAQAWTTNQALRV